MPAGWKLAVGLLLIFGSVLLPLRDHSWFIGTAIILTSAMLVARLSWLFLLKRWLYLSPFVLAAGITQYVQSGNGLAWLGIAIRSGLCVTTVIVLIKTTPFSAILQTLRRARVPGLLVTTMVLMQRYLFVLSDEAMRMRRARASRTFRRGRRIEWHALSSVVGQLFLRASDRAERIYQAMCARGWR